MLVAGGVQGVGYRAAVKDKARFWGLTGWVRNLPDGRVEIVAEGPLPKIELLERWCWQGPPLARVTDVNLVWEESRGGQGEFEIIR